MWCDVDRYDDGFDGWPSEMTRVVEVVGEVDRDVMVGLFYDL
jgi:hypothetical protein